VNMTSHSFATAPRFVANKSGITRVTCWPRRSRTTLAATFPRKVPAIYGLSPTSPECQALVLNPKRVST
jgi:hypothetical protein